MKDLNAFSNFFSKGAVLDGIEGEKLKELFGKMFEIAELFESNTKVKEKGGVYAEGGNREG